MTTWDSTVDLVIVGSGGGGMVAALTAAEPGRARWCSRSRSGSAARRPCPVASSGFPTTR